MRSRFVQFGSLVLLLGLAACQAQAQIAPTPTLSAIPITHGPIAGAVTASTANIWVRTNQAARVQVQYSTAASLQNASTSPTATTSTDSDFTTIVKITNLAPRQTYFYTILINEIPQWSAPYPHFQTFAPRGDTMPFRFVYLTDFRTISKISHTVGTFRNAARENPAFVIVGGDVDHRNPTTLEDKRAMFRDVYTPANGMEDFVNLILHNFSLVHFWDDHDYGANNADKTYPEKADSLRVLQEYFPLYPISQHGDWQQFSYGDADFFILDARSQRDPAHDPDNAEKSMLDGDNLGASGQREWFLNALQSSQAKWKFILSPVIFNPTTKKNDSWGAYNTERRAILDFIRTNQITGVIVLSGDLHAGAIDDGRDSGLPEMVAPTANDGFDKRCLTEPTGNVGKWSVGHYGDPNTEACNGYSVISVSEDSVLLEVKDSEGNTKLHYVVKE
ncbi:MAG TPA: alkaline phosphatase D family protein [Anaerolineae bacterium]|nr:alkaline phosphatase D family protein [Anaerolineae bacterium]